MFGISRDCSVAPVISPHSPPTNSPRKACVEFDSPEEEKKSNNEKQETESCFGLDSPEQKASSSESEERPPLSELEPPSNTKSPFAVKATTSDSSHDRILKLDLNSIKRQTSSDEPKKRREWNPVNTSPESVLLEHDFFSPIEKVHLPTTLKIETNAERTYHKKEKKTYQLTPRRKVPISAISLPLPIFSSSSSSTLYSPRECDLRQLSKQLVDLKNKKKHFCAESTAQDIVACLKDPRAIEFLLPIFSDLYQTSLKKSEKKISKRWDAFLPALLSYPLPGVIELTSLFVKKEGIEPADFSRKIIKDFIKIPLGELEISHILSLFTKEDLKYEKNDATLFRGTSLSSCLYKTYADHLLEPYFTKFEQLIRSYWEKTPPKFLCLNYQKMLLILSEEKKGFSLLTEEQKEEICNSQIELNIKECKNFYSFFLDHLYETEMPKALKNLLFQRKELIYSKILSAPSFEGIEKEKSELAINRSEILIGETLFLRVFSPFLCYMGKTEAEKGSLIGLTRVIQLLANQAGMGEGKPDLVLQSFEDIYVKFAPRHRNFIFISSTPSS